MLSKENRKTTAAADLRMFGNVKVLVITALFIAMSIVLGKFLAINIGSSIRLSFENLTILMSGIFFGPAIGLVTGAGADILGCLLYGYAINPVIMLGAASIGFISGFVSHYFFRKHDFLRLALSVGLAHLVGSVIIKSVGMYFYFHTPIEVLAMRFPIYLVIGTAEFYIIYLLMRNKAFLQQLGKLTKK